MKTQATGLIVGAVLGLALCSPRVSADTLVLSPVKDNTLYEDPNGARSNGVGAHLFAGRNSAPSNSRRRAVVMFDIFGSVPPGSTIHSVTVSLVASQNSSGSTAVTLHRLTRDWGEGASDAGSPGGGGTDAAPGDATWLHTSFDTEFWAVPGGDFELAPSASAPVVGTGVMTWASTPSLVADVTAWLDDGATNFGWVLEGDETTSGTAVRFESRENDTAANRPVLTILFSPAGSEIPTVSQWGLVVMTLLLFAAATILMRSRQVGRPALTETRA